MMVDKLVWLYPMLIYRRARQPWLCRHKSASYFLVWAVGTWLQEAAVSAWRVTVSIVMAVVWIPWAMAWTSCAWMVVSSCGWPDRLTGAIKLPVPVSVRHTLLVWLAETTSPRPMAWQIWPAAVSGCLTELMDKGWDDIGGIPLFVFFWSGIWIKSLYNLYLLGCWGDLYQSIQIFMGYSLGWIPDKQQSYISGANRF